VFYTILRIFLFAQSTLNFQATDKAWLIIIIIINYNWVVTPWQ